MEVLSAASSIAGILSIAGQSIDGIVKLKQLFSDISAASKTIGTFLQHINSLLHVLNDVEALLSQLDTQVYSGTINISTTSLQIELEDCLKDVFTWLRVAGSLRPPSDLGARVWFKKVWVAINQNSVKGIREDIGRHKQALQVNLALIGRSELDAVWFRLQGQEGTILNKIKSQMRRDPNPDLTFRASCSAFALPGSDPDLLRVHYQPWSSDTLVDDHEGLSGNPQTSCNHSCRKRSSSYLHPIPELGICPGSSSSDNKLSNRFNKSLLPKSSCTGLRKNLSEGDQIENSTSEECPYGTRSSGIWISDLHNTRQNAHESVAHSKLHHEDEYKSLQNVTTQVFPECVARYISHRRLVVLLVNQVRLLPVSSDLKAQHISSELVAEFLRTLKARVTVLTDEMKVLRNSCLQASYSLYEIDQVLVIAQEEDIGVSKSYQTGAHQDMLEIRRSTLESSLLQTWTSTRDRINGWLLHSLRADDKLAQLHRSILGEQNLGEKAWARLVLKYWTLDEAATGNALSRAQSAAATNSVHSASTQSVDFWTCNESMGYKDELLTCERMGKVKVELEALQRQHHRRLYKALVNPASSESDEIDDDVRLEMI
ncbi:hypothetical protein MMC18_006599 [Xylographa bjoerkii]|nr:hypothetical protein [Xylographa bjoerkii]